MEAQSIKDECEEQLEMTLPALKDSISALDTLKPQDISRNEIKVDKIKVVLSLTNDFWQDHLDPCVKLFFEKNFE
jgi:hypothetical protein